MRLTKPAWVTHSDSKKKRNPLFGLHVHPDCSRLATGGIDAKIRIWSTLPILSKAAEENEANPKLLCTLSNHNGPVLCVRWAHHGRFLASGSDDGIVLIWNLDLYGAGKVFGSEEVNVEAWKPLKRLVGHQSDVVDIAWNRDDSMIASVGLDSTIFIWDGFTFELIRKIEGHQGFVKGVCWDPVGQYLATQSDDKTVKIWSTQDWSCVETVSKPFTNSPGSTFFRRLSWSPDGEFIAASNAMNGPIFVGAVIEREDFKSELSFVGHENTIQVAAFNPLVCFPAGEKKDRSTVSTMVAFGADDSSISIWRNTLAVPVFVAKDVFDRQILDLCWSDDGSTVYGCSSDGTIVAIQFDPSELPDLGTAEDTTMILAGAKWKPTKISRSGAMLQQQVSARQISSQASSSLSSVTPSKGGVNILQPRKGAQKMTRLSDGKRRIQPASGLSSTSVAASRPIPQQPIAAPRTPGGALDVFAAAADQPLESQSNVIQSRDDLIQNAPSAFEDDTMQRGEKRKQDYSPPSRHVKSRTLGGGERPRDTGPVRELRPAMQEIMNMGSTSASRLRLPLPVVQSKIRVKSEDDDLWSAEAENSDDDQPHRISMLLKGKVEWLDFPPKLWSALPPLRTALFVLQKEGPSSSTALQGSGGRWLGDLPGVVRTGGSCLADCRKFAEHKVDCPVSYLAATGRYGLVITSSGTVYGWDMLAKKAVFAPADMGHIMDNDIAIHSASIRPNGTPLIQLTNGEAYVYNTETLVFELVCSLWHAEHSTYWTRTRASSSNPKNIVAHLEITLNTLRPDIVAAAEAAGAKAKPRWFDDAIPLGHLESRLNACALLHSPNEYKTFLSMYAKKIADEGYRNKAEQVARDLYGPISFGAANHAGHTATVCGLNKRDLLKDVLNIYGKTNSLGEMAAVWQERLRLAASEI